MDKKTFFQIILGVYVISVILCMDGCRQSEAIDDELNLADYLMEMRPDSALSILDGIDDSKLNNNKSRARHALLKSMALDKNGIDTTTFEVLQPAIDYYLKRGNVDERLRTYYYQGRIYENAGEDDYAMQSYLTGLDNLDHVLDSLTLARMFVAQGGIYYKQYLISDMVANNLKAAEIYGSLGRNSQRLKCNLRALYGEIILNNKFRADSIKNMCDAINEGSESLKNESLRTVLLYTVNFGEEEEINSLLDEINSRIENKEILKIPDDIKMNLARGYSKIGKPEVGLNYLFDAKIEPDDILDSLTYWSVKTEILEKLDEKGKALEAYRNYSRVLEMYHDQLFSNELLFSERKHEMEIENMAKIRKRDSIIKWVLIGSAIMLLITILVYYRYRLNRAARLLAERDAEKLESESRQLRLEAENLQLHIGQLEGESDQLKDLLGKQKTLSGEARQVIRERIGMLNGLFAQALTNQESYGKEFNKYVDKIKKDKKRFQESIVKVLEGTHPEFMAYLKAHELTEREIGYVCLYAIGLRGKEIGNYLDLARHYNISTDIRRKLGLETNSENLGTFLRKLMSDNHE
ncbi:MAG: hypothetical protein K2N48_14595 [Muribaculaceae bacterium]|nr:hypothetical protein [Muribaculaceae bacterium]